MTDVLRRFAIMVGVAAAVMLASSLIFRAAGQAKLRGARRAFEQEVGSLELSSYMLPVVPDEQNIAYWLQGGAEKLEVPEDAWQTLKGFLTAPISDWDEADRRIANELVEANRQALEILSRSAGLTESTLDFDYEKGFDAEVPDMLELLRAGRLARLDARLAVAAGDMERLTRDIDILDQLVSTLGQESFLLAVLIEMAADRMFMATVHDIVESGIGDAELLSDLDGRLAGRDPRSDFRRGLAGEAAVIIATPAFGADLPAVGNFNRIFFYLFEPYNQASVLEVHEGLSRALDRPWTDSGRVQRIESGQAPWNIYRFMIPNLLDGVGRAHAGELTRRLAIQALELWRLALANGEYPETLENLPEDSYAAGTIEYQRHADGSAQLMAPDAEELWQGEHQESTTRQRPILTWSLPAPGPVD